MHGLPFFVSCFTACGDYDFDEGLRKIASAEACA
jgi:hypothetical protein